jgi:hypothetical protein
MKIWINGVPLEVTEATLSFEKILQLANLQGLPTVTFSRALSPRTQGTLLPNQSIGVKAGTTITATLTDKA